MAMNKLESIYNERIENHQGIIKKENRKDALLITLKLLLVVSGLVLFLHYFTSDKGQAFSFLGIFFALFVITALLHEKILDKIKFHRSLIQINDNEISALKKHFIIDNPDGSDCIDGQHYYSSDLDVFGKHSLFHYINRTVTKMGYQTLTGCLKKAATPETIKLRQEGVTELAPLLDFRQYIQASGRHSSPKAKTGKNLHLLFEKDYLLLGKRFPVFFIYLLPLLTVAFFAALSFNLPLGVPLAFMAVQILVNKITSKKVKEIFKLATQNSKLLKTYAKIFSLIEQEPFKRTSLQHLQQALKGEKLPASMATKRLSSLLEWFDMRGSMMHVLVNNILLWDLNCVLLIEKWMEENAKNVKTWFEVAGEIEVMSSFANVMFNNPEWSMPLIINDGNFCFIAKDLGHPLISRKERVCNDIYMGPKQSLLIITGPNMAGKSTFLRTVGVNFVLALAGAPICAEKLEVSPVRLVTSMQSSDSLDKQLSLFYAELTRLKLILDYARDENHVPVFFLVDEMLKGTNALDRQKGSVILLEQLAHLDAYGVTATHDLQLTHLEQPGNRIKNFYFDGFVENDRLLFDFKLIPGVCRSSNALNLMKQIGIYPQEQGEKRVDRKWR